MFRKLSRIHPLFLTVLLALLLSTAACQPIQPVSAMKVSAATSEREANKAIVNRFYEEVVNQKHFDRIKDIMAEDMAVHDVSFLPPVKDTEIFAAFPDLHLTVDKWVIEGDVLAALVTITGTHQAEFQGVAPTGNKLIWSQVDIWRVEDGKIVEIWHNFATVDVLQQVGFELVPPAK